jgi:hypothetical protein
VAVHNKNRLEGGIGFSYQILCIYQASRRSRLHRQAKFHLPIILSTFSQSPVAYAMGLFRYGQLLKIGTLNHAN